MTEAQDLEALAVLSRWDSWFETYGVIKDAEGIWRGRDQEVALVANYLQQRISEIVAWCEAHSVPVRLLLLKPRQRGSSTFTSAGLYQDANKRPTNACIIGAKAKQAKNLFKMISQYSRNDDFNWGTKRTLGAENMIVDFAQGRESEVSLLSAKEYDPGRSGTYQFVLATEVARWAEDGVANAADVLSGLLKCVQQKPGTTIIQETTAFGASGDFYERWTGDALDFEEFVARFEAGEKVDGKYIRVFAPWFMFPELSHDLTPKQIDHVHQTLGRVERYNSPDFGSEGDIMSRFKLTLGQISWRRMAIDQECKRDPRVFEQDYPSTWESAFLTSGNRRFNSAGLLAMKKKAEATRPQYGMLEPATPGAKRVSWRPTDASEGVVVRWEEPRPGDRYLICADVMTGQDQTQGKDPDCHSVFVLRAGKFKHGAGYVRPATVARIKAPCRWEVDLLGEWIKRLHYYYRGALIVPEVNNPGLALLQVLKPWSLPIYKREVYDEFEQKFTKQLGFKTTTLTKPMVIANLARLVREYDVEGSGVDVYDLEALAQLASFIRKPNGSEEAMDGMHDDDVMSLAIGLLLIDNAVTYSEIMDYHNTPRDLRQNPAQGDWNSQYS